MTFYEFTLYSTPCIDTMSNNTIINRATNLTATTFNIYRYMYRINSV